LGCTQGRTEKFAALTSALPTSHLIVLCSGQVCLNLLKLLLRCPEILSNLSRNDIRVRQVYPVPLGSRPSAKKQRALG